jgi:hypothetical protein
VEEDRNFTGVVSPASEACLGNRACAASAFGGVARVRVFGHLVPSSVNHMDLKSEPVSIPDRLSYKLNFLPFCLRTKDVKVCRV